jgi:hypothetical protein
MEMRLVIEGAAPAPKVDPVLFREVARAYRCFEALLSGRAATLEEVAALEEIDRSYVSRLLPLAFLSPNIVEAIVRGNQPASLTAKQLIRAINLPMEWQASVQHQLREQAPVRGTVSRTPRHGGASLCPTRYLGSTGPVQATRNVAKQPNSSARYRCYNGSARFA